MRKPRQLYLLLVVLLVLGLLLTACGSKDKKKENTATPTFTPTSTSLPPATATPTAKPTLTPAPTEKFEATVESTEPGMTAPAITGDPANGKTLFVSAGCAVCHNVDTDQDLVGPALKGLGIEAAEGDIDGHPAVDYLHQSIVDPGAVLVEGFQNLMPSFKDKLTEAQIQDIIAYLFSLKD